MPIYKCENYSNCASADTGKPIELASAVEPKCPVCSAPLKSLSGDSSVEGDAVAQPRGGKSVKIAAAVFLLALLGGGYWGYQKMNAPVVLQPLPSSSTAAGVPAGDAKAPSVAAAEIKPPAGLAPSENDTITLKKATDEALLKNKAAEAEASASKAAANELIKSAVAKIAQNKLAEAEDDLQSALKQDPKNSLAYYNLAVIKLRSNKKEDALRYFELSFQAGFPYYDKMEQDQDLASLRKDPQFSALVAKYRR
jgi:tetratricopeptide (TPR) repeat protein